MLRNLLLSALLLQLCTCYDVHKSQGRKREASLLRGQRIDDASKTHNARLDNYVTEGSLDDSDHNREAREALHVDESRSLSSSLDESSSRIEEPEEETRSSSERREETYNPLDVSGSRLEKGPATASSGDNEESTRDVYNPLRVVDKQNESPDSSTHPSNANKESDDQESDDQEAPLNTQREIKQLTSQNNRHLATHPQLIPYRLFPPSKLKLSLNSILSPKANRKECHLLTLQLQWPSPNQSHQTSWFITLGSLDDLQSKHLPLYHPDAFEGDNGEGTVVLYEHGGYWGQVFEAHTFCLPGRGVYTLTMLDWGGDGMLSSSSSSGTLEDMDDDASTTNNVGGEGGGYTLYSSDGRPILSGGDFNYMESQEFTLPLDPMETVEPSVSPAPTVSASPSVDCDWIEIDILYDMYPEETTWMVILGDYSSLDNGNITIIEQSTVDTGLGEGFTVNVGAAGGSSMKRRVCLPGEGRYSFVIFDSYYNGICCEFGDGSYTITTPALPGEILGQGGKFTTFDIATFEVPFVRAPSASPSISPYPTTSHSPTVDCKYVELELKFDSYSSETSWKITKQSDDGGEDILAAESPFYNDQDYAGIFTILTICLPGDGVYTFTIEDKAGDGICCLYSEGFYTLTYKGAGREELKIVEGGDFSYEESTTFVVPYGSTSMAPTTTPAPTIKCYDVEVRVTFDSYPYETIWLIIEGGLDGSSLSDDDSFATVVESPKYNLGNVNTTDVHVECLPEGTYTFLIVDSDGICCTFGDGEYSVTVTTRNGREVVIKQGGEFKSLESVTFSLPFVPGSLPSVPSQSIGQGPTPTADISPYWVDIDLNFDSAPYEISWKVTDDQSNTIEESPYYTMFYKNGSENHRVYLPNRGEYTFTIVDAKDNGLCCGLGNGNFQLTLHDPSGDVVILQGSDFGSEESTTFSVPLNQDTSSLWPTPLQGWVNSVWPTPSPSPPPIRSSAAPTTADCTPVNIELIFDVFPDETHWWLVEGDLNTFTNKKPKFVGKSPYPSYNMERFSNVTHSFCLSEGEYTFMIFDDGGSGMCCKAGDGSYTLTYGESSEEFATGGRFGFFDVVVFEVPFPTRSPSWTPVPTTSMPTSSSPTIDTPAPSIGSSIPDCEIMMHLTTDTDGDQNAIRWEVALGDQSSVNNAFALIVAQSEQATYSISSVSERTIDSDRVCLPGEGQYTFTIFDSNSSGDTRYRLVVDGALISYGSNFGFQESTTFSVPVTAQPTPAPQAADATASPADCTMIDISITFDDFPDETYWVVYQGGSDDLENALIIANSPYYLNATLNSTDEQVCLPGDGEYTFAIYDVANDGMCCNFGKGSYSVSSTDEPAIIVAQGAEFAEADITTFSVPIMIAPSVAPSVTPRPTESAAPTVPCSAVGLTVTFDAYSSETVWTLFDEDNKTVAESPFYPNNDFANETVKENFCLPDGSYTFLITDQAGDGNCCAGLGDGSYSIVYQDGASDVTIVDKGPDPTFVYYDSTEFTIPFVIPPTKSPTISPAPTESLPPTATCIQMEVVINFDAYPSDTLWEITVGNTNSWDNANAVIAADSPIYTSVDTYSTVTHSICLPGAETYTFTVFDGTGNGMCCDEGTGGFIILMIDDNGDREIVAEGAEFEWRLSTQFDLPLSVGPRIDNLAW